VGNLLDLEKQEHLAPEILVTPTGKTYTMVAPTITKRLLKNSKGFIGTTFEIIPSLSSGIQDVQKGPSSKAAGHLAGGAYEGVREHDKGPRTPLADFFNILLRIISSWWLAKARGKQQLCLH
jgi:hypothetical protein